MKFFNSSQLINDILTLIDYQNLQTPNYIILDYENIKN